MNEIRHSPLRMANAWKLMTEISQSLSDRPNERCVSIAVLFFQYIFGVICTFLATSWIASGSKAFNPTIRDMTICCNCEKVYGWKVSLVTVSYTHLTLPTKLEV